MSAVWSSSLFHRGTIQPTNIGFCKKRRPNPSMDLQLIPTVEVTSLADARIEAARLRRIARTGGDFEKN